MNDVNFIIGVLKSSTLEESWSMLIDNISQDLKEVLYDKYNSYNDADDDKNKLQRLIILDIVGTEIMKRWLNSNNDEYKPELLREPYILSSVRADMTKNMSKELLDKFDDILLSLNEKDYVKNFKADLKRVFKELEHHTTIQYDDKTVNDLYDDLGKSLVCLVKDHDMLAYMLSTQLETVQTTNSIRTTKDDDNNKQQLHDVDLVEIETFLTSYKPINIDEMCRKTLGTLLPESLRIVLWAYRFLYRSPSDTPVGVVYVREVSRLANLRKLNMDFNDNTDSPTNNIIMNGVHSAIINSFKTSIYLHQNDKVENSNTATTTSTKNQIVKREHSQWFGKLERRSIVLAYSSYILNGTLNDRITMTCVMLMYAFPNEPPTSEKMLRLMKRIIGECLPSEHLNKNYSLASTADAVWVLLQQNDRELYDHLQNNEISIENESLSTESPRSLQLLSTWLETCFVGYLAEHAVLFIWDQLALLGGTPDVYQTFLPQICCLLLQLLRDDLLNAQSGLRAKLLISGKKIKTNIITHELRQKILMTTERQ